MVFIKCYRGITVSSTLPELGFYDKVARQERLPGKTFNGLRSSAFFSLLSHNGQTITQTKV